MTACVRKFAISTLGLLLLAPAIATATDPAEAGSSAVQTREQVESLANQLRETAAKHGPDSVALQAGFLVETLRAGALATSEVGVVGAGEPPHQDYLRIRVLTGLIFDPAVTTPRTRLASVWGNVVAPTIGKMESFAIDPGGLELALGFGLQAFGEYADAKADPGADFELHGRVVRIGKATLKALSADELNPLEVLSRCQVEDEREWESLVAADAADSSGASNYSSER